MLTPLLASCFLIFFVFLCFIIAEEICRFHEALSHRPDPEEFPRELDLNIFGGVSALTFIGMLTLRQGCLAMFRFFFTKVSVRIIS